MRFKVDVDPEVARYVKSLRNPKEQNAFYQQVEAVRESPIRNSEPLHDPAKSKYMLRFFRFGSYLAVFQFNRDCDLIRILECRRVTPRRRKRDPSDDE